MLNWPSCAWLNRLEQQGCSAPSSRCTTELQAAWSPDTMRAVVSALRTKVMGSLSASGLPLSSVAVCSAVGQYAAARLVLRQRPDATDSCARLREPCSTW